MYGLKPVPFKLTHYLNKSLVARMRDTLNNAIYALSRRRCVAF